MNGNKRELAEHEQSGSARKRQRSTSNQGSSLRILDPEDGEIVSPTASAFVARPAATPVPQNKPKIQRAKVQSMAIPMRKPPSVGSGALPYVKTGGKANAFNSSKKESAVSASPSKARSPPKAPQTYKPPLPDGIQLDDPGASVTTSSSGDTSTPLPLLRIPGDGPLAAIKVDQGASPGLLGTPGIDVDGASIVDAEDSVESLSAKAGLSSSQDQPVASTSSQPTSTKSERKRGSTLQSALQDQSEDRKRSSSERSERRSPERSERHLSKGVYERPRERSAKRDASPTRSSKPELSREKSFKREESSRHSRQSSREYRNSRRDRSRDDRSRSRSRSRSPGKRSARSARRHDSPEEGELEEEQEPDDRRSRASSPHRSRGHRDRSPFNDNRSRRRHDYSDRERRGDLDYDNEGEDNQWARDRYEDIGPSDDKWRRDRFVESHDDRERFEETRFYYGSARRPDEDISRYPPEQDRNSRLPSVNYGGVESYQASPSAWATPGALSRGPSQFTLHPYYQPQDMDIDPRGALPAQPHPQGGTYYPQPPPPPISIALPSHPANQPRPYTAHQPPAGYYPPAAPQYNGHQPAPEKPKPYRHLPFLVAAPTLPPENIRKTDASSLSQPCKKPRTILGVDKLPEVYKLSDKVVGEGTFGVVRKGLVQRPPVAVDFSDEQTESAVMVGQDKRRKGTKSRHYPMKEGDVVALKKIIYMPDETIGMPITSIREIRLLKLLDHPSIVPLLGIAYEDGNPETFQRSSISMAFPYMEHDLAGLLNNPKVKLSLSLIKRYSLQLLEGAAFMHKHNIVHRDIKAANLLIDNNGSLKIADFGLARSVLPSDKDRQYTGLVMTRWYRAPELLLGYRLYSFPIDMWGIGCVIGEMLKGHILFQGDGDVHQAELIFSMCGQPTSWSMPNQYRLPGCEGRVDWPQSARRVRETFDGPDARSDIGSTGQFMDGILVLDPQIRITAIDALAHDWFWTDPLPMSENIPKFESSHENDRRKAHDEERARQKAMHRKSQPPAQPIQQKRNATYGTSNVPSPHLPMQGQPHAQQRPQNGPGIGRVTPPGPPPPNLNPQQGFGPYPAGQQHVQPAYQQQQGAHQQARGGQPMHQGHNRLATGVKAMPANFLKMGKPGQSSTPGQPPPPPTGPRMGTPAPPHGSRLPPRPPGV